MTAKYNHSATHVLKTGILPKTGEAYALVIQSIDNIDHVVALQQSVHSGLSDDQKAFLVERDHAYFKKHFERGHLVLGVVHGDKLVAQALMTLPTAQFPETGMTDMPLPAAPENIAVLNGVVVHPDYRGNNLQTVLADARITLAGVQGRHHIISEIAAENCYSWHNLMQKGLSIHSMTHDKNDGTPLYNMHADISKKGRSLSSIFNRKSGTHRVVCGQDNLEVQQALLALDYKGLHHNPRHKTIVFAKPVKQTHAKKKKPSPPQKQFKAG